MMNLSTSTGSLKVSPKYETSLESSTRTTNLFAMASITFSLKSAPPPPFIRFKLGSTSSAPSIAKSICSTSNKTAFIAKELGMHVVDVNDVEHIDLAIDGADEVDPNLNLIKGPL